MISPILGNNWESLMSVPASASFDVMTILAVVGIAYSLGRQLEIDAIQSAALALVSFFILAPYTTLFTPENSTKVYEVTSLPLKWMGSSGLFLGMIIALVSTRIFAAVIHRGWTIKMPDGVPPTVVKSFGIDSKFCGSNNYVCSQLVSFFDINGELARCDLYILTNATIEFRQHVRRDDYCLLIPTFLLVLRY